MKSQSIKVVGIRQWLVLSTLSIFLGSLGAIATPAWAETKQLDLTISSYGNQTFAALMQQAESLAEKSITQAFADADVTEVSIKILGERNGELAPILSATISRTGWQRQPRIQRWTKLGNSELLLGFLQPQAPQSARLAPVFDEVSASQSDREPNFYR